MFAIVLPSLFLAVAAQAQTTPAAAGPQPQERRICRSMSEPGRLAGSRRVCLSRADWERMADTARQQAEQMTDSMDSCRLRADGGTGIDPTSSQSTGQAMARMNGC